MKQIIRTLIFGLFGIYAVQLNAQEQEHPAIDAQMNAAIEQVVASDIPGVSVAIIGPEGLIWSGAAGYSMIEDQKQMSQSHLFGIGDITHHFLGAIIIQLEQEGFLSFDDTPVSILGEQFANIENADKAKIKELLNHTSGIYSWDNDPDWARRSRGIQLNPTYRWEKDEPLKYITSNKHAATSVPGTSYQFSKSNYTLLGLIIEKVTGELLEDEMRSRILTPLDLNNTYYDTYEPVPLGLMAGSYHFGSDEFISRVGVNAKFDFEEGRLLATTGTTLSAEGVGSGMVSTARDLAKFAKAIWQDDFLAKDRSILFSPVAARNKGIHSEILGFTSDVRQIENSDLIIVSLANLGAVQTGENDIRMFLDTYVENILIPVAKKYASNN
jgi:D-alanyl-D-alanine carboxypeptidase